MFPLRFRRHLVVLPVLTALLNLIPAAPVGGLELVNITLSLPSANIFERANCKPVCIKSPNPKECCMDSKNDLHAWLNECSSFKINCNLMALTTEDGRQRCTCECKQFMGENIQCSNPPKPAPPKPAPPRPTTTETTSTHYTETASWTESITWTDTVNVATAMAAATSSSVPSIHHRQQTGRKVHAEDTADPFSEIDRSAGFSLNDGELLLDRPRPISKSSPYKRSKIAEKNANPPASLVAAREPGIPIATHLPNVNTAHRCADPCMKGAKKWYHQPGGKEDCNIKHGNEDQLHCAQFDCENDCMKNILFWWKKICHLEYLKLTDKQCNAKVGFMYERSVAEVDSDAFSPTLSTHSAEDLPKAGSSFPGRLATGPNMITDLNDSVSFEDACTIPDSDLCEKWRATEKRDALPSTTEGLNHDVSLQAACMIEPELCVYHTQLTDEDRLRIETFIMSDDYASFKSACLIPESELCKDWQTIHKQNRLPGPSPRPSIPGDPADIDSIY